jgi:hypothetical protein
MLQAPPLLNKDDKSEDKVQGLNWMNHPTLMGPAGFGMVPYLMGQNQLGIGAAAAAGLNMPGGQPGVNVLNPSLSPNPIDMGVGKLGALKDSMLLSRKQPPQPPRRGSSNSDASRDSMHHRSGEVSPSNTPPLAGGAGGSKISQFPLGPTDVGKWKNMGVGSSGEQASQHIMYGVQNPSATTSHFPVTSLPGHVIANSGHVMPIGFSPPIGSTTYLPKGRGDGLALGSPRATHDKMKLRIHQVRNDDFKMQVRPDRRRKKWRGKDRDILLTSRAELTDSAVRRIGMGIITNEHSPGVKETAAAPIRALPASLGVEPGSKVQQRGLSAAEKPGVPPTTSAAGDGNYALNILADMSSIQSKEGRPREGGLVGNKQFIKGHPAVAATAVDAHLRSPVSLAATSLLMLGDDLNIPSGSRASGSQANGDAVSHFESTAASSLLQLSVANRPENSNTAETLAPEPLQGQLKESDTTQTRSTRSASFSAAEAMIMMVSSNEEKAGAVVDSQARPSPHFWSPGADHPPSLDSTPTGNPARLRFDSEATDTDSEATLTPGTPKSRKKFDCLMPLDDGEPSSELGLPLERGCVLKDSDLNTSTDDPVTSNHVPEVLQENTAPNVADFTLASSAQLGSIKNNTVIASEVKPLAVGEGYSTPVAKGSSPILTPETCGVPVDHQPQSHSNNDPMAESEAKVETSPSPISEEGPGWSDNIQAQEKNTSSFVSSSPWVENGRHPATPPPAKRPKFISTFGPATDDSDDVHSLTPLGGSGVDEEGAMCKDEGEKPQRPSNEETMKEACPQMSEETGMTEPDEEAPLSEECGKESAAGDVAEEVAHHSAAKFAKEDHRRTESGVCETLTQSHGNPPSHLSDDGVHGADSEDDVEMQCDRASPSEGSRVAGTVDSLDGAGLHSKMTEQVNPPTMPAHGEGAADSPSNGAASTNTAVSSNAVKSPKKVKMFKRSKGGSASSKVKSSLGKTRVIKIKRAKSPKSVPKKASTVPSDVVSRGEEGPSSQTHITNSVAQDTEENRQNKSASPVHPGGPQKEESEPTRALLTSADPVPSESQVPCEDAQPEATKADTTKSLSGGHVESSTVPQNRLKVNKTVKAPKQLHHSPSPASGRTGRDSKEERRKSLKTGKDLFEVDTPREAKKDGVKLSKKLKHGHSTSPAPAHKHPSSSESKSSKHQKGSGISSVDSTDGDRGTSQIRENSSSSHGRETTHPAATSWSHSPFGVCEKAFSPLSDDEPTPKETRPGKSVWEEEGPRKHKGHRHHKVGDDALTLDSKQHHHHHRHHDRSETAGVTSDGQYPSNKEHRGEQSSSRGSSPNRKRHHHRHHERRHHSHEGSRGHGDGSRHSSTTPKQEVPKRPYESISDDDIVEAASDGDKLVRQHLHGSLVAIKGGGSGHKRRRISSDEEDLSGGVVPLSLDTEHHSLGPSKHKKPKHSTKEHKPRWKDTNKHKHSHKKH